MVSQTNEQALEAAIEKQLTGTCLEDQNRIANGDLPFSQHHGYTLGYPQDFLSNSYPRFNLSRPSLLTDNLHKAALH